MKCLKGIAGWIWVCLLFQSSLMAKEPPSSTPSPMPAAVTDTAVTVENASTAETLSGNLTSSDDEDNPFVPHWTGQLGFTYSNQPNSSGQGQVEKQFSLTGTYNFTESGHYMSLGLTGGQQLVEGANTNFGEVSLEGGLGWGFFNPALELSTQQGAAALNEYGSTLTLNFKPIDILTLGLIGGGGLQSHQGPPPTISTDKIDEIDEYSYTGEFQVSVETADFLTLSLTAQDEWDTTYQWQNVTHDSVHPLKNEIDQMPSLTLGIDTAFLKSYEVELDLQYGKEYEPAGLFYSPKKAKFIYNPAPVEQDFQGISLALNYNFE